MRKIRMCMVTMGALFLIGAVSWASYHDYLKADVAGTSKDRAMISGQSTMKTGSNTSAKDIFVRRKLKEHIKVARPERPGMTTGQSTMNRDTTLTNDMLLKLSNKVPRLWINDKAKGHVRYAEELPNKSSGTPPPSKPQAILQGGDTFGDAVTIASLPYTDSGTTEGYTRDYTLSCGAGTSPDVVYKYIPATDDTINVSLLRSEYYTALAIFEDDTLHEVSCNGQYSILYQSYIARVPISGGHTYYIVVSGSWDSYGRYVLEVFNPPAPAANDNCVDVTPQPLIAGTTLTFTGYLSGYDATDDCPTLWGVELPQVWVAFTTSEWMDVELDYCGSIPAWNLAFTVIVDQCCSSLVYPDSLGYEYCPDGNIALYFNNLPPGTHFFPIPDLPIWAEGQYVININGISVAPCIVGCPPGAVPETEPNDGCWVDPVSDFDSISSGQTICGNSWVSGDNPRTSDVDWYIFTLTENSIVNFTAAANFRLTVGIVIPFSADPCDNDWRPFYSSTVSICDTIQLSVALAGPGPGVYAVIIQPEINTQFENGIYWIDMTTESAPPGPPNDRCQDVVPMYLSAGQNVQLTGNNTNAFMDCPSNPWSAPEVWEAFTIDDTLNVSINFCGTNPPWTDLWQNVPFYITTDCPCTGDWNWIMVQTYDSVACSDGNWTSGWYGLPPDTYYIPINSSPEFQQPYTMNISATQYTSPPADTLPCPRALYTSGSIWQELGPGFWWIAAWLSQCDPNGLTNSSFMDDFVIPGNGDVTVDTVVFYCMFGVEELPGPSVWDGVVVSIYKDNNGMPGGHPIFPDPNCGQEADISGGVVSTQFIQPGQFSSYPPPLGADYWWFKVPLTPITLSTDTTYWINIQPVQDYSHYGVVGVIGSWEVQGHLAMLLFDGQWSENWLNNDLGFCLLGTRSGCAYLSGDINGNGSANGIDVTYGVTYLKGGTPPPDSCDCSPEVPTVPFYATMDVNGNCQANGIDITFFVAYLKGMQPALLYCQDCPPAGVAAAIPDETPAVMPSIKMENTSNTQGAR